MRNILRIITWFLWHLYPYLFVLWPRTCFVFFLHIWSVTWTFLKCFLHRRTIIVFVFLSCILPWNLLIFVSYRIILLVFVLHSYSVTVLHIFFFQWTPPLVCFLNHVIFRSTSKAFTRRTFRISVRWNINRASFLLFLSYPFEECFGRIIVTSTKCALCLNMQCYFAISTRTWATVKI